MRFVNTLRAGDSEALPASPASRMLAHTRARMEAKPVFAEVHLEGCAPWRCEACSGYSGLQQPRF
eukprot:2305105-Pyramimonas_sp.AAC.1